MLTAFIPKFNVRFAYKSLKFRNIFIKDGKPPYSKLKCCFLCYKFKCTCNSCYVGRTKKVLRVRAEQHRTFSYAKKTYYHINRCPVYVKKLREFEEIHFTKKSTITYKKKMRDKFFMEHFEIVQKNFRSFNELKKSRGILHYNIPYSHFC